MRHSTRRRAACVALAGASLALGGCGSFWPWSGPSKPAVPEPPAVTAPVPAKLAWTLRVGAGGVGFQALVAGRSVYAAAADGTVLRADAAAGRVEWQVNVGRRLIAGVGTDGETVVVAARDGTLVALGADGRPKWTAPLGAEAVTVPSVGAGVVLIRAADNRVLAFDAASGKRRWSFQRQNPPLVLRQTSAAAITPGTAFVGLPGGRLVALGLESGALRWEAAVSQPRGSTEIERIADVVGSPLVSGREVCAASFQGKLACLELASGRPLWGRDVSTATGIDVDARLVSIVDELDVVHAFTRTGTSVWKQDKMSRRGLSAPLSLGPVLVVGDRQGLVVLLSRDDGAVAGRFATDGTPIVAAPAGAGRTAVVLTSGGTLAAVELE